MVLLLLAEVGGKRSDLPGEPQFETLPIEVGLEVLEHEAEVQDLGVAAPLRERPPRERAHGMAAVERSRGQRAPHEEGAARHAVNLDGAEPPDRLGGHGQCPFRDSAQLAMKGFTVSRTAAIIAGLARPAPPNGTGS